MKEKPEIEKEKEWMELKVKNNRRVMRVDVSPMLSAHVQSEPHTKNSQV